MREFKALMIVVIGSFLVLSLYIQPSHTLAQEAVPQAFVIQAGTGQANYRAFAPTTIQVHPGDTVRWITRGCNIHFNDTETPFWIAGKKDGKPILSSNPDALVGNVQSGDRYTGGKVNSGLPFDHPRPYFELKFDAPLGTYTYYCDSHAGMKGTIVVVKAATKIPSPADVIGSGTDEVAAALGQLQQATLAAMDAPAQTTKNGVIVTIGLNSERAQTFDFFPNAVVISVGQSVTWVVPKTLMPELGLGITSQLIGVSRFDGPPKPPPFTFTPADGKNPPSITITMSEPTLNATANQKSQWGFGWMNPGDSYTVTFTEPGIYRYINTVAGEISGYVIVQAAP